MAGNPYTLYIGRPVSYLTKTATGPWKWIAARVATIIDQTNVTLTTPQGVSLNGGAAVVMRTVHGQTNVWRPY